jgi:hypothetical protein
MHERRPRLAEILLNMLLAWRSMHSQARRLNSVMIRHLDRDIDTYTLREAEFTGSTGGSTDTSGVRYSGAVSSVPGPGSEVAATVDQAVTV